MQQESGGERQSVRVPQLNEMVAKKGAAFVATNGNGVGKRGVTQRHRVAGGAYAPAARRHVRGSVQRGREVPSACARVRMIVVIRDEELLAFRNASTASVPESLTA